MSRALLQHSKLARAMRRMDRLIKRSTGRFSIVPADLSADRDTQVGASLVSPREQVVAPGFLRTYFDSADSIEGWFQRDAALLFLICNQLFASRRELGDVLEIGVHHGLSAILTASLRGRGGRFCAVDLFDDLQDLNTSGSGRGAKAIFLQNMRTFHGNLDFMEVIVSPSGELTPQRLGTGFSFCHVDGGHSAGETFADMALCHAILVPGGVLALDDYFNQEWPGVCEGAVRYMLKHPEHFTPIAVGYNKVLLQKAPAFIELARYFAEECPEVPRQTVGFWHSQALLLKASLTPVFDLDQSTPAKLRRQPIAPLLLRLEPLASTVTAEPGHTVRVPVRIVSESPQPMLFDRGLVGLSYHLLAEDYMLIQWDNRRTYFKRPLLPSDAQVTELVVDAPDQPGCYKLELDVVWEGVAWLKYRGLATVVIELLVPRGQNPARPAT